jgi:hypothetical protein
MNVCLRCSKRARGCDSGCFYYFGLPRQHIRKAVSARSTPDVMKKPILIFLVSVVLFGGCHILSSNDTAAPKMKIEPSPVMTDQLASMTLSSSREFIMRFCGGINYTIEKRESGNWERYFGQFGPCTTDKLPETHLSKSHTIYFTINEVGVYRIVSSYKFKREDAFEPLYSNEFEVEHKE